MTGLYLEFKLKENHLLGGRLLIFVSFCKWLSDKI